MPKKRKISLCCDECRNLNYRTNKSEQCSGERIILKKFCSHCKKHTLHKEEK